MAIKKLLAILFLLSMTKVLGQSNANFIIIDSAGQMFEVERTSCTMVPLDVCSGNSITAIAMLNNTIYFSDGGSLYRYTYNTNASCQFLVNVPISSSGITSLTAGPDGMIYAAAGNIIFRYDPTTNTVSNLGALPNSWRSSGDLIFYQNELLLATTSQELVRIDLTNLANSQALLSFPNGTTVFGLATVSTPCGGNLVYALNVQGMSSTQLLPLDLTNNTVGAPACNLPVQVYDAASLSENGSSGLIIPTFTPVGPICYNEVVPPLPITSSNGISGTWSPPIDNTATTTYTFTPTLIACATTATMTIVVNPTTPTVFTPMAPICTGEPLAALPTTSNNGITGTWSPAPDNTTTTTYTFTPTAGVCGSTTTMTITVNPGVLPTFTPAAPICTGDNSFQLPTTSLNGITGTWSPAINNRVTTIYTFTPNVSCATSATMTVAVIPPIPVTLDPVDICIDPHTHLPKYPAFLFTHLSQPNYTYQWYLNGNPIAGANGNNLQLTQAGPYFVEVTDTTTHCVTRSNTVTVAQIDLLDDFDIDVVGAFSDYASIVITPAAPNLLYQMDGLPFQPSNVFEPVSYGLHSIAVKDSLLCTDFNGTVIVPGYPKFFTPNGDGINDFWNVFGFINSDNYTVSIFDRYGKFLYRIVNNGNGWDGTYNGKPLPSTDYWFVVNYQLNNQPRIFRAHFSLKR